MAIPTNPSGLVAKYNPKSQAVTITWKVSLTGLTEVKVQRWDSVTKLYADLGTSPGTQSYYVDTADLADGVTYAYRALSIGPDGSPRFYSTPSNTVLIIDPPEQVTEVTAQRQANGSNAIAWTQNPTPRAPYLYHYIERWDNVSKTFGQINRIGGNLASYVDLLPPGDRGHIYRVWTSNAAGGAYYKSQPSGIVYSIPLMPSSVVARWSGKDIIVSISCSSTIYSQLEIEHSVDGVVWDPMATVGRVQSWAHKNAEHGADHRYRVRSISPTPTLGAAVKSSWKTSAILPGRDTPLQPEIIGPRFGPLNEPFELQYIHVESSPDSPEVAARIRYRAVPESGPITMDWVTVAGSTVPAVFGKSVEVQVATSSNSTAFSEWSVTHNIPLRSRPVYVLNTPANNAVITGPVIPVSWNTPANAAWELSLYKAGILVDFRTGTVEKTSTLTAEDGQTYQIVGRAFDGELWSPTSTRTVTTAFSAEAPVPVTIITDHENGTVSLQATSAGAVRFEVLRKSADEYQWKVVGSSGSSGAYVDQLPPLRTDLEYTVIAWTQFGQSSTSAVLTTRIENDGVLINYGPGLTEIVMIDCGTEGVSMDLTRDVALHAFAGRKFPMEVTGSNMTRTASVQGTLFDREGNPHKEIKNWEIMLEADRRWYRDFTGLSFAASVASIGNNRGYYTSDVSFSVQEVSE